MAAGRDVYGKRTHISRVRSLDFYVLFFGPFAWVLRVPSKRALPIAMSISFPLWKGGTPGSTSPAPGTRRRWVRELLRMFRNPVPHRAEVDAEESGTVTQA